MYNNDATCITTGTETATCENCDERDTQDSESHPATGHSFITYIYNNDATCVTAGTETSTCEYCDETDTQDSEAHPATGIHTFETYIYNNDATCVTAGTETAMCEHCDETDTQNSESHPATGHTYKDYLCKICNTIDARAPVTEGLSYTEINKNGVILGYSVYSGDAGNNKWIKIPSEYNGKPVMSIGYRAFSGCGSLTA